MKLGFYIANSSSFAASVMLIVLLLSMNSTFSLEKKVGQNSTVETNKPHSIQKKTYHLGRGRSDKYDLFYKSIDEATDEIKLTRLNDLKLNKGEFELRFWLFLGMGGMSGFRLQKSDGVWHGWRIARDHDKSEKYILDRLSPPQIGWDGLWDRLIKEELLTLPDCEDNLQGTDVTYFVVEVTADENYRSYVYSASNNSKCPGVERVMRIFELIP